MAWINLKTTRGYGLLDVASALQKAIRRGDARLACYWALELYDSNYGGYVWRRLLIISAEDCFGIITGEVESLSRISKELTAKQARAEGRLYVVKAALLLAMARKTRDTDHFINLVYNPDTIPAETLADDIDAARKDPIEIPDYAHDCHTTTGRKKGKTRTDFFLDEQAALTPREPGLFDADVEALRAGRIKLA
jgi:replication-associated recombination protein RarA